MRLALAVFSLWFLFSMPTKAASLTALCNARAFIKDCNKDDIVFLKYKPVKGIATLKYKIDPGSVGEISADEAFSTTVSAFNQWEAVSNLNFIGKDGGKISKDVTANNYLDYLDAPFPLGYSPIIWDADGSISEELSGDGSRNSILAFGGPGFFTVTNGDVTGIKESYAFFNGYFFNGDNTGESSEFIRTEFLTTVLHEVGHMFGLDHAQGGNLEGYLSKSDLTTLPIMFPFVSNSLAEVQHDDIAIVKDTYPQGDEKQNYGRIEGSLTDGGIGVRGVNVVAFKADESNPRQLAVSCPSDVDGHRTGNFILPTLVPGEYIVFAEPIYSAFVGGSSIGNYGAIDPSKFTTGFYNGEGEPIIASSDLNTGIAQAKRITVTAGATQAINFEMNSGIDNGVTIEPSFTAQGEAFNKSHLLKSNKKTKVKIVLNNLDLRSRRQLLFSTAYPNLVKFVPSDSVNVFRREKTIKVVLASRKKFLEQIPELQNGGTFSIPVTITDISTRYINDSGIITVF